MIASKRKENQELQVTIEKIHMVSDRTSNLLLPGLHKEFRALKAQLGVLGSLCQRG